MWIKSSLSALGTERHPFSRFFCQWGLLLTGLLPSVVQAGCESRLMTLTSVSGNTVYDVFSSASYPLIQSFRVRSDISGDDCRVNLVLKMDDEKNVLINPSDSAHPLRFDWFASQGYQQGSRWVIPLSSDMPEAQFQIRIPGGQWAKAGVYQGTLSASLANEGEAGEGEISEQKLTVRAEVRPEVRLQFYGLNQRHYLLDAGILTAGKVIQSAPQLWVRSTGSFQLSVVSENQGRLRHQSDDPQWDISYQLSVANRQIPLNLPDHQWYSGESSSGETLPMQLVIGDTERKPGGRYQDTLHLSVSPAFSQSP